MKTAESISAEWFKHSPKMPIVRYAFVTMIKEVQLDSYRAGMEAAARMCAESCYSCEQMLYKASKTAQLP